MSSRASSFDHHKDSHVSLTTNPQLGMAWSQWLMATCSAWKVSCCSPICLCSSCWVISLLTCLVNVTSWLVMRTLVDVVLEWQLPLSSWLTHISTVSDWIYCLHLHCIDQHQLHWQVVKHQWPLIQSGWRWWMCLNSGLSCCYPRTLVWCSLLNCWCHHSHSSFMISNLETHLWIEYMLD